MPGDDCVVLVTGAGGGLGGAMARGLLAAGRRVVAIDLPLAQAALDTLAAEAQRSDAAPRLLCVTGSIRAADDTERIVARARERFGAVHALINNAGIGIQNINPAALKNAVAGNKPAGPAMRFYDVPPDRWQEVIDTNLTGSFFMARAIAPHLVESGWGRIVNVVTSHSTMHVSGFSPYGASKAGLEVASAVWANELAGTGVTVNALLPGGAADTAMVPREVAPDRSALISPADMAAPVVWLTSPQSDWLTGGRIIAKNWDPALPAERNIGTAVTRAGWLPDLT
jgi:3-oxoacyl-[acyl-carrier protein] reductase